MTDPSPPDQPDATRIFDEHRDVLMAVAYRVLGRVADAEDVVQEAWLRWARTRPSDVADPRSFLVRVATRLAIDRLRRIKARRESYVGPWLPEPVLTEGDVHESAESAESLSLALLVVLETLSPLERGVFVLREAFGFTYAEIAETLGRSEPAVRQLARRARVHVRERRPRFDADPAARRELTARFMAAARDGDLRGLLAILAPDVTLVADGGGRVRAPLRPVEGADRVARFLVVVATERRRDVQVRLAEVNGGPGIVVTSDGAPITTLILEVSDDRVQTIYLVANPDKLSGMRPRAR